jgi:NAD(P) transhydrogenase
MGDRFTAELSRLGLTLCLGDAPTSCSVDEKTRICTVGTMSGRRESAQAVVASSGRSGNVEDLNLAAIGIVPDKRGNIAVDRQFRTAVPNVFAAGDVIGFPGLASTSMEQGRVAVCNAFGFGHAPRLAPIFPYGIYTIPELSYVGASEEELRKRGTDYVVGQAFMRENGRGQILGAESGVLKMLVAPDRKILGVHILGPSATELIHVGSIAMMQGATIDLFVQAVFNYPTLAELYKYAAYDALEALQRRSVSW